LWRNLLEGINMANLLDPIVVPQGTWVDIYAATGITAGVAIDI
jgi:hypothetical protein